MKTYTINFTRATDTCGLKYRMRHLEVKASSAAAAEAMFRRRLGGDYIVFNVFEGIYL